MADQQHSKKCSSCGTLHPLSAFTKSARCGHGAYCKACRTRKLRAWKIANRDRVRANKRASYNRHKAEHADRMRAYRAANAEALRAKVKAKYHANREQRIAAVREWRAMNPEKARAGWNRWQRANPGAKIESNRRRKIKQRLATPNWASLAAMRTVYEEAASMCAAGADVHVDHIVPLGAKLVCGLHCEANLRIVPSSENLKKSYWTWPDMP